LTQQFDFSYFHQLIEILGQSLHSIFVFYPNSSLFPRDQSDLDIPCLVHLPAIFQEVGPRFYILCLDIVTILLQELIAHLSTPVINSDTFVDSSIKLGQIMNQFHSHVTRNSSQMSLGYLLVTSLSANDKLLFKALHTVEIIAAHNRTLSEIIDSADPPTAHFLSEVQTTLSTHFPMDSSLSSVILFVNMCELFCFDVTVLIDILTSNETDGLAYLIRALKSLDLLLSRSGNIIFKACSQVKNLSGKVQPGGLTLLAQYDSDSEPEATDRIICGKHAIIWAQLQIMVPIEEIKALREEFSVSNVEEIPRPKRKLKVHGTLPFLKDKLQFLKESQRHTNDSVVPSEWNCFGKDSHHVHSSVQTDNPSLSRSVISFLFKLEVVLKNLNDGSHLPFNATPLLRRLRSINQQLASSVSSSYATHQIPPTSSRPR
jgi:hypothetical protein